MKTHFILFLFTLCIVTFTANTLAAEKTSKGRPPKHLGTDTLSPIVPLAVLHDQRSSEYPRESEKDSLAALSDSGSGVMPTGTLPIGQPSKAFYQALVAEAQADIIRFEAKHRTALAFLEKEKVNEKYARKDLYRAEQLFRKNALSASEYEQYQQRFEQNQINQKLLQGFVDEESARIEGARARLLQATALAEG